MTRIPWCEWRPGPASKRGYGGTTQIPVSYREGEVKHSAEGPLSATFGVLDNPNRQASWHFTLPKQGPVRVYQHYELEDICWHCGLPGDERHDTSLVGNLTLWGEEHEGIAGEALTPWQEENTIKLSEELRRQSPTYGREPPTLRVNLWEHNWLSPAPTACPSGRMNWGVIIPALQAGPAPRPEEDDMFGDKDREKLEAVYKWAGWQKNIAGLEQRFVRHGGGLFLLLVGSGASVTRHHIANERTGLLLGLNPDWSDVVTLTAAEAAAIPIGDPVPNLSP